MMGIQDQRSIKKWLPPTVGGKIIAVIGLLLIGLLVWVTPAYFSQSTYHCGSDTSTYGPFYLQGIIHIVLILGVLTIIGVLSRFYRWWQKLLAVIALLLMFAIAFAIALSHMYDGYCF